MIPCVFFVWIPPFIFILTAVNIIFMTVEEVGRRVQERGWKVCVRLCTMHSLDVKVFPGVSEPIL